MFGQGRRGGRSGQTEEVHAMPSLFASLSLPSVLRLDAATCAAMGALLLVASEPVGTLTRLPPALLFGAGVLLVPVAAFIAVVAARPHRALVGAVIAGNLAWVAASFVLLLGGFVAPNAVGVAFVLAQALAVLALSAFEHAAPQATRVGAAGPT
jgi:hypothetical protein